ncbi:IclR family transcriptional regulator [Saccharomonospora piscinae]|uniref:Glycerol operon regulatory protein n=1 Tax=Saccharomonospora piscinae TaxID=687388 RepID=A0A1V9A4I3_SACPI|nr:IclR family transcriptional regulator [Saccharomonospora piscinae]OQO92052.1 transcriptional regulator [Saccharomonospora piscinae]TLW92268.1 IclR family transcriptional regulator [Saccharomonospora piscinae]
MSGRRGQGHHDGADTATKGEERDYTVRAVERVCSILNLLQESVEGVSLIEVAQETDLPKSSAFRYLWTLEAHRYVERDDDSGLYRLGLGFVGMQSRHLEVLRERARPWLEKIRDEFGETVNLAVLDRDHVVYVDVVESGKRVRFASSRGFREPWYATALGRAIAARLPGERLRELLPREERETTPGPQFANDLERVRSLGYATSDDGDGRCVAAALSGTRLPVALGISAPAARFSAADAARAAARLIAVTREIATAPIPEQRGAIR